MKQTWLAATILILAFSSNTYAKGGKDPSKLAFKNTLAGFVAESAEEAMRRLVRIDFPELKNEVRSANVVVRDDENSSVTVKMADESNVNYNCIRFDDFSNSGTVIKKEVTCFVNN